MSQESSNHLRNPSPPQRFTKARAAFFDQLERDTAQLSQVRSASVTSPSEMQLDWKTLVSDLLNYDTDLDRAVHAGTHIANFAGISQIQDLRALMRINDPFVMGVVVEPLARLQGPQALPLLFQALRCLELEGADSAHIAGMIAHVVRSQPVQSWQMLMHLLGDSNAAIRRDAVWAMSFLPTQMALPPLLGMLRDARVEVRVVATNTLKHFCTPVVIDALCGALRDWEPEVRCAAAAALGWIGNPRTMHVLAAARTDQDPLVRAFVHEALQRMSAHQSKSQSQSKQARV